MSQSASASVPTRPVPDRPPLIARLRLPIGYLVILGAFIANTGQFNWWALALVALGSFLRIWSAGTLIKTRELSTSGPYALSRNPLYLGSFFAGTGLALFVQSLWLFVFFIVTFALAYRAQILWEELVLRQEHGESFERFEAEVGRFFPTRWNSKALEGGFSIKRLVSNKEIAYQVFWIVMVLGLVIQAYMKQSGISFSRP